MTTYLLAIVVIIFLVLPAIVGYIALVGIVIGMAQERERREEPDYAKANVEGYAVARHQARPIAGGSLREVNQEWLMAQRSNCEIVTLGKNGPYVA